MISATIVTIGDELLIGQTIDTNSAWIGQQFNKIGIQIKRRIAISDKEDDIISALNEAAGYSEIIITTGGLGPTNDDITKETLCKYFDTELQQDENTLRHIKDYFTRRGRELLQVNIDQAQVPKKCSVLFNAVGTAPGMMFTENGGIFFSLPGVPFEMKHLISERVIPILKEKFEFGQIIHKTIITSGMGESFIAERLKNFEKELSTDVSLAYLPNFGMVKLRISGDKKYLTQIETAYNFLANELADIKISDNDRTLEEILFDFLKEKKLTIAIAESCTGGNIAAKIVSLSGASKVFKGSTVTYAIESKQNILDINPALLEEYTDVSKETATAMAENVRIKFKADIGLSTTGFLEGEEQYFYSAVSDQNKTLAKKFNLPYSRKLNSSLAVSIALQFSIRFVQKNSSYF